MVKHIEAWDVEPGRVVRSLIRPSVRMPTNRCARPLPCLPYMWSAGWSIPSAIAATNIKPSACFNLNMWKCHPLVRIWVGAWHPALLVLLTGLQLCLL